MVYDLKIFPDLSQICDDAFKEQIKKLSDIPKTKDLTKEDDMLTMQDFVSLTLFHEVSTLVQSVSLDLSLTDS